MRLQEKDVMPTTTGILSIHSDFLSSKMPNQRTWCERIWVHTYFLWYFNANEVIYITHFSRIDLGAVLAAYSSISFAHKVPKVFRPWKCKFGRNIGFKNPNWRHDTIVLFKSFELDKRQMRQWPKSADSLSKRFTYISKVETPVQMDLLLKQLHK